MQSSGVLRVMSNSELDEQERLDIQNNLEDEDNPDDSQAEQNLAAHIKREWQQFRWHRNQYQHPQRYLHCLRQYNGVYDPKKLAQIKEFGGSEVFSQLTAVKCRGAASLLRDVFLAEERPWVLKPTPDPEIPEEVFGAVNELIQTEISTMEQAGMPVDPSMVEERRMQLNAAAKKAAFAKAHDEALKAENKVDDLLVEGNFYRAMQDFITDLTIFPVAFIKGPEVKKKVELNWTADGAMETVEKPKMFWRRVSPFDMYWTPGASCIEDADVIERIKLSRKDLNCLLGVEGYNDEAIRRILSEHPDGWQGWEDSYDTERAHQENKESPYQNWSNYYDTLEFHGALQGQMLLDHGFRDGIADAEKDYHVVAWLVADEVIKVQINPNPKQRHTYYSTCFEKIPGSVIGNALPEILTDSQDVANASFRSLVNNLSIASGPQVVANEERLSATTDSTSLHPWKIWHTITDPMGMDTSPPISFFQPESNASELMAVYQAMTTMADEISAIPRYITGQPQASGGAASTASGLSMLMNNASKVLQNIAASIDSDILQQVIADAYLMVMVTDGGVTMRGDEAIVVRGVSVAAAKEMDRMRQLELLQLTANPVDMQVMGINGRAALLRAVTAKVGLPHEEIIPDREQLKAMQQQMEAQQAAQAQGSQGTVGNEDGKGRLSEETDNLSNTRNMSGGPQ